MSLITRIKKVHTNIKERIVTDIVDIHEKGISTHINVCIHKNKYSFNCMYTQMKVEFFLISMTYYVSLKRS